MIPAYDIETIIKSVTRIRESVMNMNVWIIMGESV